MAWDWLSFLGGAALAGAAAFGSGFAKKAGEVTWDAARKRFWPEPMGDIEVDRRFDAVLFRPGDCAWSQSCGSMSSKT